MENDMVIHRVYPSPIGDLMIVCDHSHIRGLYMENQKPKQPIPNGRNAITQLAENWLDQYFLGNCPGTDHLPLAPEGTPFQRRVWEILTAIPYGASVTYGQIAAQIAECRGQKKPSAQAVGQAVGANPIGIMIPCHRVLGKGDRLCGYAGGIPRKKWLLDHEGIFFRE